MPHKSGFSHGLAAFFAMIVAAIVIDFFRPLFPTLYKFLINLGLVVANFINGKLGTHIDPVIFTVGFITFILAFIWGVLYHFARR